MDSKLTQSELGYFELASKPSKRALQEYYAEKYYQEPSGQYQSSYSKEELDYFINKAKVCEATLDRHGVKVRTLFEVGAGEGFFAQYFCNKGLNVTLNDFSDTGIKRFNPELLPRLLMGDALECMQLLKQEGETFDLVSLDNVLEHVLEPSELMSALKALMVKESVVKITVPNDFSDFQDKLLKHGLTSETWICPPDHITYFNASNVLKFLEKEGFLVLSAQADYPIEQFLVNPHSNYWKERGLGKGAHQSRIFCTNYLVEKDIQAYISYCEYAAQLEFGRGVTVYAKKNST